MSEFMERVEFFVPGVPVAQGSMVGYARGKQVSIVHSNAAKLKPWRNTVAAAAHAVLAGRDGFEGAVAVLLDFYVPRGSTVRRLFPSVRPDLDKYTRSVLDSLTTSGIYGDDGQVVSISARKHYAEEQCGVRIVIRELA